MNCKFRLSCPISMGELYDKITILEIKKREIRDLDKKTLVEHELRLLVDLSESLGEINKSEHVEGLRKINKALWDLEEEIRDCIVEDRYGSRFIEISKEIRSLNEERFKLKSLLNDMFESDIREVKSY